MTSVAICCIALNEDLYIDEWLEYHFGLGFNHVYVYDNSPEGSLKLSRTNVTVIHFPGSVKQVDAYNNFIECFADFHDWCAFIDVDEFFVLHKHKTIQEYIDDESQGLSTVGVNWMMYGSCGQETYEPRPVMERFAVPSQDHGENQHIKCIVKTRNLPRNAWGVPVKPPEFQNCHFPQDTPIRVHIPGGFRFLQNTPFNENWDHSVIQLNHYFCKSREEFIKKIQRGRADTTDKRTMAELF